MMLVNSILCIGILQIVLAGQDIGDPCTTSNDQSGICKPQHDCLALQNSTLEDSFSETCNLGTDGTPIVCCTVGIESNDAIGTRLGETPKDEIETRAFNGPRKKQYIPYKTPYKTPIKTFYNNFQPAIYNEIYQAAFQNKINEYANQNVNFNNNLEPSVFGSNQFGNYNPNLNQASNHPNFNSYGTQNNLYSNSIPEYSNVNFNKPTTKSTTKSYVNQPVTDGVNFRPNRPTDGQVNYRPVNSASRPSYENNYNRPTTNGNKPVNNNHEEPPIWGGNSDSTTRRTRTPKTTSTTSRYQTTESRPTYQQNQQNQQNQQKQRISEQKCLDYSKIVTQTVSAVPLTFNSQATSLNVQDCPIEAAQLIVGGRKAELGEYPHMAALGFRSGSSIEYNCGGTLISEDYVLTAAHCTHSSLGNPIHVKLGDLNLNREDDGAQPQIINVQQTTIHPNYKAPQLYNDVALIKLGRRVSFTKFLRPACLYQSREINVDKVIATGWGSTNYGETSSDDLLKVGLNVIDNRRCNSLYGADSRLKNGITETMMCAGELSGNKDTCQGDSGGPLQTTSPTNKCVHYIVGVTSFGKSCGVQNSPGIYTRVSEYVDWIESVVWKNNY